MQLGMMRNQLVRQNLRAKGPGRLVIFEPLKPPVLGTPTLAHTLMMGLASLLGSCESWGEY